ERDLPPPTSPRTARPLRAGTRSERGFWNVRPEGSRFLSNIHADHSVRENDMRFRIIPLLVLLAFTCGIVKAQQRSPSSQNEELYALARTDLKSFAQQVSKDARSELGRAQAIVRWLAQNFEWKATDYQQRTVQQIIQRRGGNCNELAMVALASMKELAIKV